MSENTVAPPTKGDPITADWAASLCAAANAGQFSSDDADTLRTPNGASYAVPPPRDMGVPPPLPPPFTVRLVDDESLGELHAWVYVPASEAEFVRLGATPCRPNLTAADNGTGWYDLGEVEADGDPRFVVLAFNALGAVPTFDVALQTSRRVAPTGCCPGLPVVALASVAIPDDAAAGEDASDPASASQLAALSSDSGALGLVQLHSGALVLPDAGLADLDCTIGFVDNGGTDAPHLYVRFADCNFARINGRAPVKDDSNMTGVSGWAGLYDLGPVNSTAVAWLVFDAPANGDYADATNYPASVATASVVVSPTAPVPANVGNHPRVAPPVAIWRASGSWSDPIPSGVQLVRSSIQLPLAVPDAQNVRDDGKLFASVEWGDKGQTQLRGFEGPTTRTGAQVVAAGGVKVPVRFPRSDGGAEVFYVDAANVAFNDGGSLLFNGDVYAPTQITYTDGNGNPQTITVLAQ